MFLIFLTESDNRHEVEYVSKYNFYVTKRVAAARCVAMRLTIPYEAIYGSASWTLIIYKFRTIEKRCGLGRHGRSVTVYTYRLFTYNCASRVRYTLGLDNARRGPLFHSVTLW